MKDLFNKLSTEDIIVSLAWDNCSSFLKINIGSLNAVVSKLDPCTTLNNWLAIMPYFKNSFNMNCCSAFPATSKDFLPMFFSRAATLGILFNPCTLLGSTLYFSESLIAATVESLNNQVYPLFSNSRT